VFFFSAEESLFLSMVQHGRRTPTSAWKSQGSGRLEDPVPHVFSMEIGLHGKMD